MAPYALVVDGTATLPVGSAGAADPRRLPQHVVVDGRTYTPGVDLTPAAFYALLVGAGGRATTEPPTLEECREVLRAALVEGAGRVVVLCVAEELSETLGITRRAAEEVGGRIEVIDTRTAASAIGLMATALLRERASGGDFGTAVALARRLAGRIRSLAVVDDHSYLARSARLSAVASLFGGLHSVRSILEFREGRPLLLDTTVGREQALEHLRQLVSARLEPGARIHVAVLHTDAPEQAERLLAWARERFHCLESWGNDAGPLIASHSGPGLVGLSWFRAEDADAAPRG